MVDRLLRCCWCGRKTAFCVCHMLSKMMPPHNVQDEVLNDDPNPNPNASINNNDSSSSSNSANSSMDTRQSVNGGDSDSSDGEELQPVVIIHHNHVPPINRMSDHNNNILNQQPIDYSQHNHGNNRNHINNIRNLRGINGQPDLNSRAVRGSEVRRLFDHQSERQQARREEQAIRRRIREYEDGFSQNDETRRREYDERRRSQRLIGIRQSARERLGSQQAQGEYFLQ